MNTMVFIKENSNLSIDGEVINFLNPDYVYIPIKKDAKVLVNTNSDVFKEEALIKINDKDIYSSISGKVIGKTTSMKLDNNDSECIVIENDFKEKVKTRKGTVKYINEYAKEEFLDLIKKYNACKRPINLKGKTLIISGIDVDPYEHTYSYIINSYSSKLLETIDALASILGVKTTILAINSNDSNNVINLTNNIGTYPDIKLKLTPDVYPIGFKEILIKYLLSRKEMNQGYTYLTVEDIYNIYNVLKRRKPITEKLITISGNALENSIVVNAKIGASMADLIKNTCRIVDEKYYVITNGLIAGNTLTSLNNIITSDIRSIFLNTKDKSKEKKCINCGLCNSKCPVGLNPKYLKEHKKTDKSKCIHCGLCTYICPSKINFKESLGGNREK